MQGQRDRADDAGAGRRHRARARRRRRRAASRCSPGASRTPGVEPLPIMSRRSRSSSRSRRAPSSSGPARARCSNLVQADSIGCHIITMTNDLHRQARISWARISTLLARDRPDVPAVRRVRRLHAVVPPLNGQGPHHRRCWLHRQHPRRPAACRRHRGRHLRQPVDRPAGVHRATSACDPRTSSSSQGDVLDDERAPALAGGMRHGLPPRRERGRASRLRPAAARSRAEHDRDVDRARGDARRRRLTASPSRPPARSTASPRSSRRPRRARSRCRRRSTAPRSWQGRA